MDINEKKKEIPASTFLGGQREQVGTLVWQQSVSKAAEACHRFPRGFLISIHEQLVLLTTDTRK